MWTSLAVVALVAAATAVPLKPVSAETVEAYIRDRGGRSTIDKFFPCDENGESAYAQIASGDKRWLAIAVHLLDNSDACVTTSLLSSIGAALPRAPANVLRLLETKPILTPSRAYLPFLSDEEDPNQQMRYLRRVESILRKFSDPSLRTQRDKCLREVRAMKVLIGKALRHRSGERDADRPAL